MDVVLGSTGFLGTNFCKTHVGVHLNSKNFNLRIYVETRDFFVGRLSRLDKIGTLYNFAGKVGGIHSCSSHPMEFMTDNLLMGMNVIRASVTCPIQKIVYTGSVCSYPNHSSMIEDNLWNGYPEGTNAPYGIAKKTIGELLMAHYKQYGQKSVYPILANMYGPHDNFSDNGHVIPMLIVRYHQAHISNQPEVTVWGTGAATRDFLYVEDAIKAIHILAEKEDKPIPINVGTGEEYPIHMVAKLISDIVGYRGKTIFDSSKPDGQKSRRVDIRLVKKYGWAPETDLQSGLEKTYEYYLSKSAVCNQ